MKVTVLGCGSSGGVPLIGCECPVCTSDNPKNTRSRVSICMDVGDTRILVDTSPDLRMQCLNHQIKQVNAILYTHAHADHCHGIDDVRSLNFHNDGAIDIYGDDDTISQLKARFPYIFTPHNSQFGWYKPLLTPHIIAGDPDTPFHVADEVHIIPFQQQHGKSTTLGFRVENFAYSTDVNNLSEKSIQAIENIDVWLVDCLRYDPAPTHAHLDLTLEWIERVKPKRAVLTHMGHELEYETLKRELPAHVEPAYDGMVLEIAS